MKNIKNKKSGLLTKGFCVLTLVAFSMSYLLSGMVSAAQITARSVTIGSSIASASTTYSFNFTLPSSIAVKSIAFEACTLATGACMTPTGFSSGTSTLTAQPTNLGSATGWTVNTASTGSLRAVNASNSTSPSGNQTVSFSNVTNPSAINNTFFMRISTYSDSSWTSVIDQGTVATSTAGQVSVSVVVGEKLSFNLTNTSVPLSEPSTSTTGTGTSSMTVSTNGTNGYSLSYKGNTLTSGANTITAMTTGSASTVNTKQFGINLMLNTTPSVGANVAGSGNGSVATGYNTTNQFKFVPAGDVIASSSSSTNDNTYTTSYIVNMDGSTAAGVYSTVITYVAVANF